MYEFYCDPEFNRLVAEARAARRNAIRSLWMRMTNRGTSITGRVASNG